MRYAFGQYVVDTRHYSLARAGQSVSVRPKVFDVLCYLLEHRARVVSKQELLDALWREPFVDDFAVPWTVSHLRKALDQERGAQEPIQTVRGRGYRFVAEVGELPEATSPPLQADQHSVAPIVEAPTRKDSTRCWPGSPRCRRATRRRVRGFRPKPGAASSRARCCSS